MRRFSLFLLVASLAIFALPSFGTAQAPRRSPALVAPLQLANRALIEGRYNEVEALTEKLDARDPGVVAVRARAAIARGRYAQAETALRPVAGRAPASEAALQLGLLQQMLGRSDAPAILEKVALQAETSDDANEIARGARALRALGRFKEANAAYRLASSSAPNDPAIETAWGELLLEKYNKTDALKSFQLALQADAKWAPALLGSARALEDENPPQAVGLARRVLEINPSSVDAQVFLAGQAADAGHQDEAHQALQKALAVNPSSLDAHALVAALAYVQDRPQEFEAEAEKTLAIAPTYGDVYRTAGDLAAHNYRFDEAVTLTRRALSLDGKNPRALADLGTHLLRTGDEPGARTALEAAFEIDPYNLVTLNLLRMMDTLDKFVTVRDGDLVMRLHKDEAPVLQEYALSLSHQALNTLAARYEFTPRGPILVEIFPKHDDFAVRNVGLPGLIGALGICFGRVVTMDSPRARPPGEFQWEATLWHELAHVITLQMSNERVPRWLTEGISVYEEKRARPEWGREMDVAFAGMLNRGETVKLRELNAAFQNPKTMSLAYYEASLLVEHLVTAYGDAGLRRLLRTYGQGLDTDAALTAALNTNFDQLQAGFDESVERQFGAMRKALVAPAEGDLLRTPTDMLRTIAADNPRSFPVQMALGRALRRDGKTDEAMLAFERAAQLVPLAGGKDSPHDQMAAMAIEKKDTTRATAELTALVAVDFNNIEAARLLAALLRQSNVEDPAKLGPVYQRIAAIDPFDADAHANLGRLALQRKEADAAAREFRAVIALGPVDRAAAFTDLAESYFQAGKRAEAKKQTLAALEIAPTYERAQGLLLKLVNR
ncbi:MAG TPA: tetratricopeptide repeat protein [Vicinamibacterales bacterium]|nr:tetratricopeptide repeat protein [Vicinamibacterales bacterium]